MFNISRKKAICICIPPITCNDSRLLLALFLNDLFTIIVSALRAYLVALFKFVALRAFNKARSFEFPVCKTGIRF